MARAQDRLAALVEWVKQSSASYPTPLGHETAVGPYAVFISQALNLPPNPCGLGLGHLPLWLPASQAIPALPPLPFDLAEPPASQGRAGDRLRHLVWVFEAGRFEGALIPLTDPAEPLQAALDRHVPDLDLAEVPALFLRVWDLNGDDTVWIAPRLPLVRV
jgi:hypothetical protein